MDSIYVELQLLCWTFYKHLLTFISQKQGCTYIFNTKPIDPLIIGMENKIISEYMFSLVTDRRTDRQTERWFIIVPNMNLWVMNVDLRRNFMVLSQ